MTTLRFQDLACPKCGHHEHFHVDVTATATLDERGTVVESDYYWDGHSICTCLGCGFEANAAAFATRQEVMP
jgi:predicted nucleic-acid-binding Zn-ribbon protein